MSDDGVKRGRSGVPPPVETRWKPGQSGHSQGVPRGKRLVTAILEVGKLRDRTRKLAETIDAAMGCGYVLLGQLDEVTRARLKKLTGRDISESMVYQLGFQEWMQLITYVYPAMKQVPGESSAGGLTLADVVAERRRAVGE